MARGNTTFVIIAGLALVLLVVGANGNPGSPAAGSGAGSYQGNGIDPTTPNATEYSNAQFGATQQLESFVGYPYSDGSTNGVQDYSIGYGHQIQPAENYLLSYSRSNPIPQTTASALLQNDMQTIVDSINNTGVSFTQGQLDATTDLGMSGVQASLDLINVFNSNGADAVAAWLPTAYVHWHPVPGGPSQLNNDLVARRQQELVTWNAGSAQSA